MGENVSGGPIVWFSVTGSEPKRVEWDLHGIICTFVKGLMRVPILCPQEGKEHLRKGMVKSAAL